MKATCLVILVLASSLFASISSAQSSSTWPLTGTSLLTPTTVLGNFTPSNEVLSPGSSPSIEIFDYTVDGQRLRPVTGTSWVGGGENSSRFIQFDVTITGTATTVSNVAFEYGAAGASGQVSSNAFYSTNNWTTRTQLNGATLAYQGSGMASFSKAINVSLSVGAVFSVRIYPFALQSSPVMPIQMATHRNLIISGTPYSSLQLIEGQKFNDLNGDGDKDPGENGLSGFTIEFVQNGIVVATSVTGNSGFYSYNAPPGTYILREVQQSGWQQTFPANNGTHTVVAGPSGIPAGLNFGNRAIPRNITLSGRKFVDLNSDGIYQSNENWLAPRPNVTITATVLGQTTPAATATTDSNGNYSIVVPLGPVYVLAENAIAGYTQVFPSGNTYQASSSDANLNFGNRENASSITLSGKKFVDLNGDGVYQSNENWLAPRPPVTIQATVFGQTTPAATATTDANGNFSMSVPGGPVYIISESATTGYSQVFPPSMTYQVSTDVTNLYFGNRENPRTITLSGKKFVDLNSDGIYQSNENWLAPRPSVTIAATVFGQTTPAATATTDANGNFSMVVPEGPVYIVSESSTAGYTQVFPSSLTYQVATTVTNLYFGNRENPSTINLSGKKFVDLNGDGIYQSNENWLAPRPPVTIAATVFGQSTPAQTVQTDANGNFSMSLPSGPVYIVSESATTGYTQVFPPNMTYQVSTDVTNLYFGNRESVCAAPPPDMVGWWSFDHHPNDLSGYGNNGLLYKNFVWLPGQVNESINLVQAHMLVLNSASLNFGAGQNFSIDTWIKSTSTASRVIVDKLQAGPNNTLFGYRLSLINGQIQLGMGDGSYSTFNSTTTPINNGNWHFIAVTVDRDDPLGIKMYVDGQLVNSFNPIPISGSLVNNGPMGIGSTAINHTYPNGPGMDLDELEIFSRDLTLAEIQSIYNAGSFGKCKNTLGIIEGTKFKDGDGDGIFDVGSESPLAGVTIQLMIGNSVLGQTVTDANGNYSFEVSAGTYSIEEIVPGGYTQTGPPGGSYTVVVGPGATVRGLNFGNTQATTGGVTGLKFIDVNGNGVRDPLEGGWSGVTIEFVQGNTVVGTAVTTAGGSYQIDLPPGSYTAREVVPTGSQQTFPPGGIYPVVVTLGGSISGIDFGNQRTPTGTITGCKFDDKNNDGVWQGATEPTMAGVTIQLLSGGTVVASTVTGSNGCFSFVVPAGTYSLQEVIPTGYVQTLPAGGFYDVVLSPGGTISNQNFGNYATTTGTVTGTKFNDYDGDGKRGRLEPGMPGIVIEFVQNNVVIAQATTNSSGFYTVSLLPGTYLVREVLPTGYAQTAPTGGTYTITVALGQTTSGQDFGNQATPTGSVEGTKFLDLDGDGVRDPGEPGLQGVIIELLLNGNVVAQAITDANGSYFFTVTVGSYTLREVVPGGYLQTLPSGNSYPVTITNGGRVLGRNFGNKVDIGTCIAPPSGMVGWWPGDLFAVDLSGYANGGSMHGGATFASGKVNNAFTFANSSDYVAIPDAPQLNFGSDQDYSIDFWVKSDDPTGWANGSAYTGPVIMSKMDGNTVGWQMSIFNGRLWVVNGINQHLTTPRIDDGLWHFVSVTLDRSVPQGGGRIYIDAFPPEIFNPDNANVAPNSMTTASPLMFGRRANYMARPTAPFIGQLDEVEIFNRVLTPQEVAAIYTAGAAGKCKDTSGSVGGTKFNDLNGNGARDGGEPGLAGVSINVLQGGSVIGQTTTAADGSYTLNVPVGTYVISETPSAGWYQTFPSSLTYNVVVTPGSVFTGFDFGNSEEVVVTGECVAPPKTMVAWWSGDDHANDISVFGQNGILQGAASYAPGMVGQAFKLTNSADFVQVPDAVNLDFGDRVDLSMDAWIKTSAKGLVNIVDKRTFDGGRYHGYGLFLINGTLGFQLADGSFTNFMATSPALNNNQWHFVAVSVDRDSPTGLKMYVDGQVTTHNPMSRMGDLSNTSDLFLGKNTLSANVGFAGIIDEVELFRRALSEDEFSAIYKARSNGKCKDGIEGDCDFTPQVLGVGTGFDHPANAVYAINGSDAFWTITVDPDPNQTVPRPATVIRTVPGWAAAPAGSQWLGPIPIVPFASYLGVAQEGTKAGLYRYALEFCIVGDGATNLTFSLNLLADNSATIWLVDTLGNRYSLGTTGSNPFGVSTIINQTINASTIPGGLVAGTYRLEVDVRNVVTFTGMNLTGSISGANLFMQKHDCCNSDAHITGNKFDDANGNGVKDSGENGRSGIVMQLWQKGVLISTTTTDAYGNYYFDVPPGTYEVKELLPAGFLQTLPSSGGYSVILGPGGMAANRDFGNQAIPCIYSTTALPCKPGGGGRYLQLTSTYSGPDPVYGIQVSSLTQGASFTLTSVPAFPILPGSTFTINVDFAGIAPGASAQMLLNLRGAPDAFGVSGTCCEAVITITRPGGLGVLLNEYCPNTVVGVLQAGNLGNTGLVFNPANWTVRAKSTKGGSELTFTDMDGFFAFENMVDKEYDIMVDDQFGFELDVRSPRRVMFSDMMPRVMLSYIVSRATSTSVDASYGLPTEFSLAGNYPNPFNPSTTIQYALPVSGSVRIEVFDMLGRRVSTLINDTQAAGRHELTFDASSLPTGVYLYRMTSGSFVQTNRMLLMK